MNNKESLCTSVLAFWQPYQLFCTARRMKWIYSILCFMVVFCLLFLPVLISVISAQPAQLYTRVFSRSFENADTVLQTDKHFANEYLTSTCPTIYVFNDIVVYADAGIRLSTPAYMFTAKDLSLPFDDLFGMIAVYNGYITQFLLPVLMIAFMVLLVLQALFFFLLAVFLGTTRQLLTSFGYRERMKIVIMSSFFPAVISAVVGFLLPAVHIVLFQMIDLLLVLFMSNKYGKRERELLLLESDEHSCTGSCPTAC